MSTGWILTPGFAFSKAWNRALNSGVLARFHTVTVRVVLPPPSADSWVSPPHAATARAREAVTARVFTR
jgi:hypothetical protein